MTKSEQSTGLGVVGVAGVTEDVMQAARRAAAKVWAGISDEALAAEFRTGRRDDSGSVRTAVMAILAERERSSAPSMTPTTQPATDVGVDQKPVALAHITVTDDEVIADLEVLDGTLLQPEMTPVPLYVKREDERVRLWNENRDLRASLDVEKAVTDSMRIERDAALSALRSIAAPRDCGCSPVCQCNSQESLQIEVDALQDIARAALTTPEDQQ